MAAHLYWRLVTTRTISPLQDFSFAAGEIEFRGVVGGPSLATGGTASCSSWEGTLFFAFDGDISTLWYNGAAPTVGSPGWIAYEFTSAVDIAEVAYVSHNSASYIGAPENLEIQYSDNGIDWTLAKDYPGPMTWTQGETKLFLTGTAVIEVQGELTQPYDLRIDVQGELTQPYSELLFVSELSQPYSLTIQGSLAQPYDMLVDVAGELGQPYGFKIEVAGELTQIYSLTIQGELAQPYGMPLFTELSQPYSKTISGELSQPYLFGNEVQGELSQPYGASISVQGELTQVYDLLNYIPVAGELSQPYSMGSPGTKFRSNPAKIERG